MQVINHKKFIEVAKEAEKEIFVKVVVTSKIKQNEIQILKELLQGQGIALVLQPVSTKMKGLKISPERLLKIEAELSNYIDEVRVIPQTHKYIDVL